MTTQSHHFAGKGQSGRVTISDMAEALNLTKSTVSRAMNGYPDISDATQLRVKRMAEKLRYQPLSHAQAIKTGRTRSLGLVLQMSDHDAHRPFLTEFLAGLSEGASNEGYTLTVASADTLDNVIGTYRNLKRDGKADGFVLPRALKDDTRVDMLRDMQVPFVLYGRPNIPDGCAWYDVRGEDAMRDAVMHLAGLGHDRIAFINGGAQYTYAGLRRAGFLAGANAAGMTLRPDWMLEDAATHEAGVSAGRQLLGPADRPTAIVCAVDHAALGVYRAAAEHGLTIGKDISVIAYDGVREGAHAEPPLTTFAVNNRRAGQRLASLLIRRIRGEPSEDLRETESANFQLRNSTGPAQI